MYMAEMRSVTTLFVKLDSYSPQKHKNLLSLQVSSGAAGESGDQSDAITEHLPCEI